MSELTKNNVKRLKTVGNGYHKKITNLIHEQESSGESNIVNITINNNISTRKKKKSRSKLKINRQKTAYCSSPKRDIEKFIEQLKSKNVQNINININYNQIERKHSNSEEKKRASSLWKKTKNFQRMLHAFVHPSVEKIDDKDIFCDTLKNTLLDNDKSLKEKPIFKKNTVSHNMTLEQFLRKSEVEKEFIRVNLKAKAFKLITEGVSSLDKTKSIIEEFEKLFVQNPEKERFLPEDKHYLFNQRLSNGKTLLYIACQEGATEIVKYFLEKRLNPNIKAIYYDMEDTCLAVAVRWNFYDIVKLILESNRIYPDDIEETLENENCNEKIKELLFSHIPEDRKKKRGCGCF